MRKLTLGVICLFILAMSGCNNNVISSDNIDVEVVDNQQDESGIPNEASNDLSDELIEYEGEAERTLIFGQLTIQFDSYHIASKVKKGMYETFSIEVNKGEDVRVTNYGLTINEFSMNHFDSVEDATDFFNSVHPNLKSLYAYESISDESGITHLYSIVEEERAYYYVFYEDNAYVIESEYMILETMLFDDFQTESYIVFNESIQCGKTRLTEIEKLIYREEKQIYYRLFDEKGIISHYAEYGKAEDGLYHFILRNNEEKIVLDLTSYTIDLYDSISFLDVNLDGYVDIKFLSDSGAMNNNYKLYTWSSDGKMFERVVYDDILSTIEVYEGYLINRVKDDAGGGVVQKLIWEDNELIMESEEQYDAN